MEERPDRLRRGRDEAHGARLMRCSIIQRSQLGYDRRLTAESGHDYAITQSNNDTDPPFEHLAVVGAGNMGSGIAQKMATEGFEVCSSTSTMRRWRAGGRSSSRRSREGVQRKIFRARRGRRDPRPRDGDVPLRGSRATPTSSSKPCSRTSRSSGGVLAAWTTSAGPTRSWPPTRRRSPSASWRRRRGSPSG